MTGISWSPDMFYCASDDIELAGSFPEMLERLTI